MNSKFRIFLANKSSANRFLYSPVARPFSVIGKSSIKPANNNLLQEWYSAESNIYNSRRSQGKSCLPIKSFKDFSLLGSTDFLHLNNLGTIIATIHIWKPAFESVGIRGIPKSEDDLKSIPDLEREYKRWDTEFVTIIKESVDNFANMNGYFYDKNFNVSELCKAAKAEPHELENAIRSKLSISDQNYQIPEDSQNTQKLRSSFDAPFKWS